MAGPLLLRDLWEDPEFLSAVNYADPEAKLTGEIGRFAGAAIIDARSRGIVDAAAGSGGIDVHYGTLIGGDAVFAALAGLHVIPVTGPDKWTRSTGGTSIAGRACWVAS